MADLVTMNHPGIPGDENITRERSVYRNAYYPLGWRSADDPGFEGETVIPSYDPGTVIGIVQKADSNFTTASLTPVAITGLALPTFVMPAQPVVVVVTAWLQVEEVGQTTTLAVRADEDADQIAAVSLRAGGAGQSEYKVLIGDLPDPFHAFEPGDPVTLKTYLQTSVATSDAGLVAQDAGGFGKFVATLKVVAG